MNSEFTTNVEKPALHKGGITFKDLHKPGVLWNNIANATARYCGVSIHCTLAELEDVIQLLDCSEFDKDVLYLYFIEEMPEYEITFPEGTTYMHFPNLIRQLAEELVSRWDDEKHRLKVLSTKKIKDIDELPACVKNTLQRNGFMTIASVVNAQPMSIYKMKKISGTGYMKLYDYLNWTGISHKLVSMNTYALMQCRY